MKGKASVAQQRGRGSASVPEHLRSSRIHSAGCAWAYTDACTAELLELQRNDSDAYEVLVALILDAFHIGLDVDDNGGSTYVVPVGQAVDQRRHFTRKPMPWLGELKAEGTRGGKQRDFRLYFLETTTAPGEETTLILGSSLPIAGKGVAGEYDKDQQTDHMRDAMWRGIHWCDEQDPARYWRTWD